MKNFYIYAYINNDNIIEYIGKSTNLTQRIDQHKNDKLSSFKGKIYYYRCHSQIEMDSYEYFLIRKYKPQYNELLDGENLISIQDPEWTEFNKDDFMPVREDVSCRIAREGDRIKCIETGKEYISTRAAERDTNIPHGNIAAVCKGERLTAGGYHWEYTNFEVTNEYLENFLKRQQPKKNRILCKCIETDIIYNSIREAARETGICRSSIMQAIDVETRTAGGYHWRSIKDGEDSHVLFLSN